jgi:hypothetical protein
MTPKSLVVFSLVTIAMAAAAAVSVANRPAATVIPTDRPFVFEGLGEQLNSAFSLEVQTAKRKFTIQRFGDRWGVAELKGYPANFDKVKTAIVELSQLRYLEPKTADAARFDRLDLRDVTTKGAKSKQVTLKDKDGKVLAQGLIGKRNEDLFGTGKGGVYMRIAGKKESWLIEGIVSTGEGPSDWVSKKILDINGGAIKRLQIESPKGGHVAVSRKAATDKNFTLEDLPAGKRQRGEWETNQMPKAFENLALIDLKRAEEVDFGTGTYKGSFTTFDGLVIKSEAAKVGKKYWIRLAADTVQDADEATKKRAQSINERLVGYVYEVKEEVGKKLACEHVNLLEGAGIKACA